MSPARGALAGSLAPRARHVPVAQSRAELAQARSRLPGRVAVVMTMGALHEGHATLIRQARAHADSVVVTIFVNPLQFGAGEDLDRYPRTLAADLEVCAREGADLVFAPTPDVVYPDEPLVRVAAGPLGEVLEGAARPGHFDGVLTVVLKLLHLVHPQVALFGQKDAQQLACIRAMVRDLDVPVEVVGVPTVREADGLALSSRNRYLSRGERSAALSLFRALSTRDVTTGRALLDATPGVETDYLARVRSSDFREDPGGDLLVVAARVGATRLIDNVVLPPGAPAAVPAEHLAPGAPRPGDPVVVLGPVEPRSGESAASLGPVAQGSDGTAAGLGPVAPRSAGPADR